MSVDPREAELFGFHEKTDLDEVKKHTVTITDPTTPVDPDRQVDVMASTSYSTITAPATDTVSTESVQAVGGSSVQVTELPVTVTVTEPVTEPEIRTTSETASEQSSVAVDDQPESQENDNMAASQVNVHARRRMGVFGAAVALALAVVSGNVGLPMHGILSGLGPMAATPQAPDQGATDAATLTLQSALKAAQEHHSVNGTYRGVALPAGVNAVTGQDMIVIASVINGACWYSAIVPGYDPTPRWDATASRCNPERLQQLQSDVDATE